MLTFELKLYKWCPLDVNARNVSIINVFLMYEGVTAIEMSSNLPVH